MAQSANPSTIDWCLTVQADLAQLKIGKTESEIKKLSNYRFRKMVNTAISKECVLYLETLKNSHKITIKKAQVETFIKLNCFA